MKAFFVFFVTLRGCSTSTLARNPHSQDIPIVNPRPPVRQALENAPFSDFLAVHADIGAALAALAA